MSGNDLVQDFTELAKQLEGIEPSAVFLMIIALMIGILFVSWMIIRQQGIQIKHVIAANSLINKQNEERHKRDMERLEARVVAAEERAILAEKRADEKDAEALRSREENLKLREEYQKKSIERENLYEEERRKHNQRIDDVLNKIEDQERKFSKIISEKDSYIEGLEQEKWKLESCIAELTEEVEELSGNVSRLTTELKEVSGINEDIAQKLTDESSKNAKLLRDVAVTEKAYGRELEKLNKENESLKEQLNDVRNQSKTSTTRLEKPDSDR